LDFSSCSTDFNAIADYPSLNSNASNLQTFLINLVEGIANTVQEVLQFGYQNVVIVNIPPLDMTPELASPEKALFRMEFRSLLTAVNANIAKVRVFRRSMGCQKCPKQAL
jgi:phospholipase/lecithinase/hemolysin